MKQRPHAALIKAWADGAVIQYRACPDRAWQDSTNNSPSWVADCEYRIKPEPKPDVISYLVRYTGYLSGKEVWEETTAHYSSFNETSNIIKLVRDGETGKLKSAEVLK